VNGGAATVTRGRAEATADTFLSLLAAEKSGRTDEAARAGAEVALARTRVAQAGPLLSPPPEAAEPGGVTADHPAAGERNAVVEEPKARRKSLDRSSTTRRRVQRARPSGGSLHTIAMMRCFWESSRTCLAPGRCFS
jgi:hypothetical protein